MASRWMQSKLAIMRRNRAPYSPDSTRNRPGHTVELSNHLTAATAELVKAWEAKGHKAVKIMPGPRAQVVGKRRATFNAGGTGPQIKRPALQTREGYYGLWDMSHDGSIVRR